MLVNVMLDVRGKRRIIFQGSRLHWCIWLVSANETICNVKKQRLHWGREGEFYVVKNNQYIPKCSPDISHQIPPPPKKTKIGISDGEQVRIQDLVKGGPQLLRPKVADIAKRSRASEASILRPGSRARLRALEAFGFLMLKYAFSHILETLFLLFLTSILTPKVDKNRALDFTSINLRHSDMLHLFFNLHEKLCFNWMTWGMPSEARLKILWHGWWKIDQLCDW